MTNPENLPLIVNVEPRQPEPKLLGMTILDSSPLAEALTVLGVPEDDVVNWKFYSDRPKNEDVGIDERTVIFNPSSISDAIELKVARSLKKETFYDMFKPVAARAIMLQLARSVVSLEKSRSNSLLIRRKNEIGLGAAVLAYSGTVIGMDHAGIHNIFELLPASIAASYISLSVMMHLAASNHRAAKKLIAKDPQQANRTMSKIEEVILPIYTPRQTGSVEPGTA